MISIFFIGKLLSCVRLLGKMDIFLDYSAIGQLYNIDVNEYTGRIEKKEALKQFRSLAEARKISCYMSNISKVEMLHGREKPGSSAEQVATYKKKDESKLEIAESLGVIWLSYPASWADGHLEDKVKPLGYSVADLTHASMGPNWEKADELQKKLLQINKGTLKGDARQIVSMVFGTPQFKGKTFIAEDEPLVQQIRKEVQQGRPNELSEYFFGSAQDFLAIFKVQR